MKQDNKIKITVVVPIRNRYENLKKSLKHLLNQKFDKNSYEIIIVDYGGTDNLKDKLKKELKDKRVRYFYAEAKGRWNEARSKNIGIRRARGEFVISINGDILFKPKTLKILYDDFKKRGEKGKKILYQVPCVDIFENKKFQLKGEQKGREGDFQATYRENWLKVRGYNEKMEGYGYVEYDLITRMKKIRVNQYWMPIKKLVIHHIYHPLPDKSEYALNRIKLRLNYLFGSYYANDNNWGSLTAKRKSLFFRLIQKVNIKLARIALKISKLFKIREKRTIIGYDRYK